MADIELVIKIDEEEYIRICDEPCTELAIAVRNGTPLPKGHGRLIDEKDLSLATVHLIDGIFVCDAPTIIEADKGETE